MVGSVGVNQASRGKFFAHAPRKPHEWCPGPDLNRYGDFSPTDFKSVVSTNFTTRAGIWRRDPESNWANRICNPGHNRFAIAPLKMTKGKLGAFPWIWSGKRVSNSRPQPWQGCALPTELFPQFRHYTLRFGAGEESRTLDLNLGKVALYQLSYSRKTSCAL